MERLIKKKKTLIEKISKLKSQLDEVDNQLNQDISNQVNKICENNKLSTKDFFGLVEDLLVKEKTEKNEIKEI
ncbi:hypothetical protein LV469_01345 [Peptoniphilus sp. GNH]|nr:hypothetical protein LV469_01345 [Peptoniphilus sp. GNH]